MPRFVEPLEPRRLLSVSPTIQADLNLVRGAISSVLADAKHAEKLSEPDLHRLRIDFRHANPSQKHLFNVFNGNLGRGVGDFDGSLSFVRHIAGFDLPLVISALNSLQRNPGNTAGEAMLSSAVSWLTTDSQTGGLLAEALQQTNKASSDLSTLAASLPSNAPAQRDVANAQTDVTVVGSALNLDSTSLKSSVQKLIADVSA
jgi:hypothetical protein